MAARARHAVLVGVTFVLVAAQSAADDEPSTETTKVIVVEVDALPEGEIPSPPPETDAPTGVPAWTQPATITVTSAGEMARAHRRGKPVLGISKKSSITSKRAERVKLVAIAPTTPSLDALYAPSAEATELEAQASQKLSCGERESVLPMRWEALATTTNGDARLSVHDLWFDAKTCAVGPGPETTVPLKAIAWEDGKPWLYAMRSRAGVTLVMPRVSEISSESMVGAPVSVRGDFTRITMPVGRWGSGSIVAQLDSLGAADAGDRGERPVEVGIELVQTMSERAPTLLVRTRRANVAASDEGRD
jgi:hypothetical protein